MISTTALKATFTHPIYSCVFLYEPLSFLKLRCHILFPHLPLRLRLPHWNFFPFCNLQYAIKQVQMFGWNGKTITGIRYQFSFFVYICLYWCLLRQSYIWVDVNQKELCGSYRLTTKRATLTNYHDSLLF